MVTVALFTHVSFDKELKANYQFVTNRTILNGTEIPAKSPKGMFKDILIPNDLNMVFKQASAYYKGV